ncbi:MAG: hypothetical protein L6275_02805, partial [Candidatus Portnoybacteria bacterium]|nr:hypothetical protein [Candidatus Portnoybacteria bacterium]
DGDGNPWNDIIQVSKQTMDSFEVSNLVRAIDDSKVYQLEPNQDTGIKRHLNLTAEEFVQNGYDWDAVFIINQEERDFYE